MPETKTAGWDSKVRARAVEKHGSVRAYANHLNIDISDIPENGRTNAMKVWSRIVDHFGGTGNIEDDLNS